ncbi:uncharacterized protein [Pyxicephalus adspersus]|uniref:uncharacterized protein n=1 Tax=Pyxicephalus adspersus TaxID=30357 RepID=UPI003B59DDB1
MEFLQRHFPRVYQVVQDAVIFFTNVTAQIFGAPPDAPQPRNARANVPIRTPEESEGLAAREETGGKQGTSPPGFSRAAEENGDNAWVPPGNEDNRLSGTDLRHRRIDPEGTQDLEHTITEGIDIVLYAEEITSHTCEIEVTTESKSLVTFSQNVQRIIAQDNVSPTDQLEWKKENQTDSWTACEIEVSQHEEQQTMADNEPLCNSEQKPYKDGQHIHEPSSNTQHEEYLFQPKSYKSLSFGFHKEL